MKIYGAWEELKEYLSERRDFWYGAGYPEKAKLFDVILNKIEELEMKHE